MNRTRKQLKKSQNTKSEENYLKNILILLKNRASLPLNILTQKLKLKSSSITSMLKKLEEKKMILYQPYKGVQLLPSGEKLALQLVRKHRLWECFLFNVLKFNWSEIHEIAEQLEHVDSVKLTDRLEEFLGFPIHDPHGDPIPDKNGYLNNLSTNKQNFNLNKLLVGEEGVLIRVLENNKNLFQHLSSLNISLGCQIKVVNKINFDNSYEIILNNNPSKSIFVSEKMAKSLIIKK